MDTSGDVRYKPPAKSNKGFSQTQTNDKLGVFHALKKLTLAIQLFFRGATRKRINKCIQLSHSDHHSSLTKAWGTILNFDSCFLHCNTYTLYINISMIHREVNTQELINITTSQKVWKILKGLNLFMFADSISELPLATVALCQRSAERHRDEAVQNSMESHPLDCSSKSNHSPL